MVSKTRDKLRLWQAIYVTSAAVILPIAPFLYLQGQLTRRRVGVLPGAAGGMYGSYDNWAERSTLLVIGESTIAGLGARTHETAMAGQFAKYLSAKIGRGIDWTVIGKNGVTAGQTIKELVPQIPDSGYDHIMVGLGGNDVLKLSSPVKWRRDMLELLAILRENSPHAMIYIGNCPMIKLSPALPQPIRSLLWGLSRMHDANIRSFTRDLDRVLYYPQPTELDIQGFFADGIHPSEKGYSDWARAMVEYFFADHK